MLYDVFYAKHPSFDESDVPKDWKDFEDRWAFVRCVQGNSLGEVYSKSQGCNWSPNGEAREVIQKAGVHHTSMSVGDIIRTAKGEYFIVADFGFNKLELEDDGTMMEEERLAIKAGIKADTEFWLRGLLEAQEKRQAQ